MARLSLRKILILFVLACLPMVVKLGVVMVLRSTMESPEEVRARAEEMRTLQENWEAYREEEKKNGGPLYRPEDLFPQIMKPDHWEDFFVLASVPEGFYYKDREIHSKVPGDWTITYTFHDADIEEKFFFLTQSADYDYNKGRLPEGVKKKEGEFFAEKDGTRNIVYWFYNDITVYLEGNLPMGQLEALAKEAVHIDDIFLDYGAVEQNKEQDSYGFVTVLFFRFRYSSDTPRPVHLQCIYYCRE